MKLKKLFQDRILKPNNDGITSEPLKPNNDGITREADPSWSGMKWAGPGV